MASNKQINANRRNAERSTGPKTAAGKSRSSLNNLVHGLRARTVVLPDESRDEFDRLHGALDDHYQPQNPPEQDLVDQMAIAKWKLVRAETLEAGCFTEEMPLAARVSLFDRLTQIQGRLERAYLKAYKELERIKAAREELAAQAGEAQTTDGPANKKSGPSDIFWTDESGKIWMHTAADRAGCDARAAVLASGKNDEETRLAAARADMEAKNAFLARLNEDYQAELAAEREAAAGKK